MDTKNERGRGRPNRQPQADSEVVRPNFGQHTHAIEELRKALSQETRWRDQAVSWLAEKRKDVEEAEQRLASRNRHIESYTSALRALGGWVPGEDGRS
jgi:hypothetical protein